MTSDLEQAQVVLERRLTQRALQGDDDAFVSLGSMYSEQAYALARNLSRGDEEALELTQGAFQRAREQLRTIPEQLRFRIFVYRLLVSDAVKQLRRSAPSVSESLEPFLPRFEAGKLSVPAGDNYANIEELANREDLAEHLRAGLEGLTPEDRAAYVLRTIHEFSLDEMAAILEVPASMVQQRMNRAQLLLAGYVWHLVHNHPASVSNIRIRSPW